MLDGTTTAMGAITVISGLILLFSALIMPPGAGRLRRGLRLLKAVLFFYVGGWWLALGLEIPNSIEISRDWLRPAIFLALSCMTLAVIYDVVAPWAGEHWHRGWWRP